MDFDVFDKLSELETEIHILKSELNSKDAYITQLMDKNTDLERQLLELNNSKVPVNNHSDTQENNTKGPAEMLKETSESVTRNCGYTFDEKTGLYFDSDSGYYYDPEYQLFYEPKSGTYYKYNAETKEYTYHSKDSTESLYKKFKEITCQPAYQHMLKKTLQSEWEISRNSKRSPRHRHRHWRYDEASRSRSRSRSRRRHSRHRSSSSRSRHYIDYDDVDYDVDNDCYYRDDRSRMTKHRRSSHSSDDSYHRKRSHRKKHHRRRRERSNSDGRREDKLDDEPIGDLQPVVTSFSATPIIYPPSVRLMVLASEFARIGELFVILSKDCLDGWGCVGRSSALCPSAHFPDDPNVDNIHCEFVYSEELCRYFLMDRSSQTGTYINGVALKKKRKTLISHGDILRIGSSRVLIHIHEGQDTCGQCDPTELKAALDVIRELELDEWIKTIDQNSQVSADALLTERELRDVERRSKLVELKEKYGVKHPFPNDTNKPSSEYVDRAAQRRSVEAKYKAAVVVADQPPASVEVPPLSTPKELPVRASVGRPIGEDNKGAQLLVKMGWIPGLGLGKHSSGIAEPIVANLRLNPKAGLGSNKSANVSIGMDCGRLSHSQRLAKTRERYERLD